MTLESFANKSDRLDHPNLKTKIPKNLPQIKFFKGYDFVASKKFWKGGKHVVPPEEFKTL